MYGSATCTSSDFFECGLGGGRVAATAAADAAPSGPDAAAAAAATPDAADAAVAADALIAGADAAAAGEDGASAAHAAGTTAAIATKITAASRFDGRAIPLPRLLRGIERAGALTACCTRRSRGRPA
jgi:hypothetical protein